MFINKNIKRYHNIEVNIKASGLCLEGKMEYKEINAYMKQLEEVALNITKVKEKFKENFIAGDVIIISNNEYEKMNSIFQELFAFDTSTLYKLKSHL